MQETSDKKWDADLIVQRIEERRNDGPVQVAFNLRVSLPSGYALGRYDDLRPETRPLARLEKALEAAVASRGHVENENVSTAPYVQPTFRVLHGFTQHAESIEASVKDVLAMWRTGQLAPPVVSLDLHKAMVEHGVALRTDGLFGYKLKCRRPECSKIINGRCYAVLEPDVAVEQVKTKRSGNPCSTKCGLLCDDLSVEDWWPDIWHEMGQGFGETKAEAEASRALLCELCTAAGVKYEPENEDDGPLPDGSPDIGKLMETHPALADRFLVWFDENFEHNGDDGEREDNEAACDI